MNDYSREKRSFSKVASGTDITSGVENTQHELPVSSQIQPERKQHLNILLAEDNYFIQMMVVKLLEIHGHRIIIARNGKEAVELWQKGSYDVVLMDVQMPEVNGLQATEKIREVEKARGGHTRIIAITANTLREDVEMCFKAGVDDYIPKPLNINGLLEKLDIHGTDETHRDESEKMNCHDDDKRRDLFHHENMTKLKANRKMFERYTRLLLDDLNVEIMNMENAIQEGNPEKLKQASHTVKGMGGYIKSDLSQLACELEELGSTGRLEGAHKKFTILKTIYEAMSKKIEDYLENIHG